MLFVVAPGKAYYQIRFSDVPPEYILGGACLCCAYRGPVNRGRIEKRFGADHWLRGVDGLLRCTSCGNRHHNRFVIYGRRIKDGAASSRRP